MSGSPTAAVVALALWFAPCSAQEPTAARRPNVVLISIDDLNDWVGVLGGHPQARTPNIDRLAHRGTLFANAHCQAPVCTPSRASLFSGRLPSTTGLYFLQPQLQQSPVLRGTDTMVERFAREGWETLGVGKLYHGKDDRYFQKYGGTMGGFGPRPKQKLSHKVGHPLWDWGAYPEGDAQMPDTKVADWAIARLGEKRDKPFVLGVGFWRPHVPMYAPKKWFDLHPRERVELPLIRDDDRDDLPEYGKWMTIGLPAPRHEWFSEHEDEWRHAVQAYLASTTFVDAQVGRVLDALARSDYADNTIVVLFSDHGFHLGEKQRWAKRSIWEDSTRVPMVIVTPVGKPAVCRKPVGLLDIYPTLLELCGLDADPALDGRSLTPLLADAAARWPHAAITTFGPGNHAVRSTRWRYIRYRDGSEELYDHESDPHEWRNLAGQAEHAEVIARHRHHLPARDHAILPGSARSSGHAAFVEAERKRGQ